MRARQRSYIMFELVKLNHSLVYCKLKISPLINLAMDSEDMLVTESSNSSSTTPTVTAPTGITVFDCAPLNGSNLIDVFTKMDIGNTEFWGSVSVAWMIFFIMYCVLLYVVLLGLFCFCVYFLFHALKQLFFLRTSVYSLALYILWFALSFVYSILVINNIASDSGADKVMADVTRTMETVTSTSFVNIIIATPFSNPHLKSRFSLTCVIISNVIISAMALVIMISSLSAISLFGRSIFIILIVFRILMFIVSISVVIFVTLYKFKHLLKPIGPFFLLWRNKILLVIVFPYFLLSCSYFLYTLGAVVSNSDCVQNIQLNRTVWLVFNFLLRICEVIFSIKCLWNARVFVKKKVAVTNAHPTNLHLGPLLFESSPYRLRDAKETHTYYFPTKSEGFLEEDTVGSRDSQMQVQQIDLVKNSSCKIETEQLSHTNTNSGVQNVKSIQLLSQSMPNQSSVIRQINNTSLRMDSGYHSGIPDNRDGKIQLHTYTHIAYYRYLIRIMDICAWLQMYKN